MLASWSGGDGHLLIGVDLKKPVGVLHAAYNDAAGVTAEFNLNLLRRIRSELDTDLDPDTFEHYAFYNPLPGRIEMHLISRLRQEVRIEDRTFVFEPGEGIHTENSYKYTVVDLASWRSRPDFASRRCGRMTRPCSASSCCSTCPEEAAGMKVLLDVPHALGNETCPTVVQGEGICRC